MIKNLLQMLHLKFMGFDVRDATLQKQYHRDFPDDPRGISLNHWHEFEQKHPEIFAGMYQFWVTTG